MSEEPDDHWADEPTDPREDESGHTGHDKYRPMNLAGNRTDVLAGRRKGRLETDRGEPEPGRNVGTRRYGTAETERGARRYDRKRRRKTRSKAPRGRNDARKSASERHRSGRGGRPSDRHYGSRSIQQGRSSGNPRTGSQRGSHREEGVGGRLGGHYGGESRGDDDDQESHGDQYRYGGERGGSHRDRRYGSRRGKSTRRDPRRR